MTKCRPILFSGEMIRSILADRKSQTRRVIKPPVDSHINPVHFADGIWQWATKESRRKCPYGKIGDSLWVRETWQSYRANSTAQQSAINKSITRFQRGEVKDIVSEVADWPIYGEGERKVLYAADFGDWAYNVDSDLKPWRPSIFMPRWASRIDLEITGIRAERVQEISEVDALAEGIKRWIPRSEDMPDTSPLYGLSFEERKTTECRSAVDAYRNLWDSINLKLGLGWDTNPFVWCVSFKRIPMEPIP